MLRALTLTLEKEFRLFWHERVALFMLIAAPIAVIAAAGFSLADVFGGGSSHARGCTLAIVDEDHGEVGEAVAAALKDRPGTRTIAVADRSKAHDLVFDREALLAVVVPAGSTAALARGADAELMLYTDPVRHTETLSVELGLAEICRHITAEASRAARAQLVARQAELRSELERAAGEARVVQERVEGLNREAKRSRAAAAAEIRRSVAAAVANALAQRQRAISAALDDALEGLAREIAVRADEQGPAVEALRKYVMQLEASRADLERWFAELRRLAGKNAGQIPPPPPFPMPPAGLSEMLSSLGAAKVDLAAIKARTVAQIAAPLAGQVVAPTLQLPPLGLPRRPLPSFDAVTFGSEILLPGSLGLAENGAKTSGSGAAKRFNIFDLQVPGFAVTFLLIGMLTGVALALIDEREWRTLERLKSVPAPPLATLYGKLLARSLVGFAQMVILLAVGWALFGMSLGRAPAALLAPCAAIAFASAAFGLLVAGFGRTREAVFPVGALVIMTMAAVGGCWWPIDFEPSWMRTLALSLPTTWAMQAFNDLIIRELPARSSLVPSAVNLGFGVLYALAGAEIVRHRFG
jgi:ABC-type multidrug transport system permease subunit